MVHLKNTFFSMLDEEQHNYNASMILVLQNIYN